MSPFAIALAFDAPILKDVNSAAGNRGVVEELGDKMLKFGVVDHFNPPGYISQGGNNSFTPPRLGVGSCEDVVAPNAGQKFWT